MSENKVSKYALYATGEILLVVVGILIALQINNWNEAKKQRVEEQKLLSQIQDDIETNISEINGILEAFQYKKVASDSVLKSLDKGKQVRFFNVFVASVHQLSFFNNAQSGYTALSGNLGTIISNDPLRNEITQLYETDYSNILVRQAIQHNWILEELRPRSNTRFTINQSVEIQSDAYAADPLDLYRPVNFKALSDDLEYVNTLKYLRKIIEVRMVYLEETLEKSKAISVAIEREIAEN